MRMRPEFIIRFNKVHQHNLGVLSLTNDYHIIKICIKQIKLEHFNEDNLSSTLYVLIWPKFNKQHY